MLVSPCSDGYWPVNSEARLGVHAVDAGVMAVELDAAGADAFAGRELRTAELGDRVALVGRRVPLFVGHDDEHVGPRAASGVAGDARRRDEHHRPPVGGHHAVVLVPVVV